MRNEAEARFRREAQENPAATFVPVTFSKLTTRKLGTLLQIACLAIVALACAISVSAQQTTGAVRGIVTDPAGAVVPGAKVTAEIVQHGRGEKLIVFKFRRRKRYKRKMGHRQNFTEVKITSIAP